MVERPRGASLNIYVIHADSMRGPWSEPIDLKIGGLIDPGHVVDEDGASLPVPFPACNACASPTMACRHRRAARAGLRRLAISRQLGNRGVLARRAQAHEAQRLVLPRERSGRHRVALQPGTW